MNRIQIRDALVSDFQTFWTHPTVPVHYENAVAVDFETAQAPLVLFVVEFEDAEQVNIAFDPLTRQYGWLELHCLTRETLGTRALLTHLDEMSDHYTCKTLGGLHLGVAKTEKTKAPPGWYAMCLRVPFFADSNA